MNLPDGIAFDPSGNLFIADTQNLRIRRVDAGSGVITTVGNVGYPFKLALDATGNIFFVDSPGVGRISSSTGTITRLAESLEFFLGLALNSSGDVFVAKNLQVLRLNAQTGTTTVVAGLNPLPPSSPLGDGGPATSAAIRPAGIAFDSTGNLFILDREHGRVRAVRGPVF